jgi:hypothetical protein
MISEGASFFGDKHQEFERYVKAIQPPKPKNDEPMSYQSYSPDLIAKKGQKIYVIEIKANTSNLSKLQRKALEIAPKFDFIPLLLKVKVTTKAEIVIKEI